MIPPTKASPKPLPMQEATSKIEEKQPSEPSEPNVSESELPNLEEVTPKMSNVTLDDDASSEVPLPAATSDEEEFHEASESVSTRSKSFLLIKIDRIVDTQSNGEWQNHTEATDQAHPGDRQAGNAETDVLVLSVFPSFLLALMLHIPNERYGVALVGLGTGVPRALHVE